MQRYLAYALLGVLAIFTSQYARVWESNMSLWPYAAAHAPHKARPNNFYALTLVAQGRTVEARQAFERVANSVNPRWDPNWPKEGRYNLQNLDKFERFERRKW